MKIAFTTQESNAWDSAMEPRFGRAAYLVILDEATGTFEAYDNRATLEDAHGAGPKMAKAVLDAKVDAVITGNGPGENAQVVLSKADVQIYVGAKEGSLKESYEAFKAGALRQA